MGRKYGFQPVFGLQDDIPVVLNGQNVLEWIDDMECISVRESNETPQHDTEVWASIMYFNKE